jgi:hypothetical protein
LVALRPIDVLVRGGPTPIVARCGIDTYLVGHPDRAVESACRRHVGKDVGVAAAAMALAFVTLGASRIDLASLQLRARRRQATAGTGAGAGGTAQPT